MTSRALIEAHRAAGRRFEAGGTASFVREQGEGEIVVLVHGVPVSSFLWRKVIPELAERGCRAIAFDLPGLGLADRPPDYDYSWSGLARFTADALDALEIDSCHLVVHDIGGPIGCEVAVRRPERIRSLTALNTMLDAASFRPPWMMRPFTVPLVRQAYLRSATRYAFAAMLRQIGIANPAAVSRRELYAHYDLLKGAGPGADSGSAFLKIMAGFELTAEKERFFVDGLAERPYPAQVVWAERDPALGATRREFVIKTLGVGEATLLPAKHFPQEDHAAEVAQAVAALAAS